MCKLNIYAVLKVNNEVLLDLNFCLKNRPMIGDLMKVDDLLKSNDKLRSRAPRWIQTERSTTIKDENDLVNKHDSSDVKLCKIDVIVANTAFNDALDYEIELELKY